MKKKRKSYYNQKWYAYSNSIKKRDGFKCLQCSRDIPEVVLQTHHLKYQPELEPWEYPKSDCVTLCKGCHAREHGLVEPNSGWILISIDDRGDLDGTCERKGCGTPIRYSHEIYHPKWGYLTVGSSCVDYLTREDQSISKETILMLNKIEEFANNSKWDSGVTKKGNKYIVSKFAHHKIRIYGAPNNYSFQIWLKIKGEKWYDPQKFVNAYNLTIDQVKKLSFITLKGLTTENENRKIILGNIYNSIKNNVNKS